MEQYFDTLLACPLFEGISPAELPALLGCLGASVRKLPRHAFILEADSPVSRFGIVLSGAVDVVMEDFWGNRSLVSRLAPGELFGESLACARTDRSPTSACAAEDAQVLLLDARRVTTGCEHACGFHARLIDNLMRILAAKNVLLTRKIEHVTRRTMREKVLSYLSSEARRANAGTFWIPFDRQALADYLAVDRSALSAELSRMKREGILDYEKNRFVLKKP